MANLGSVTSKTEGLKMYFDMNKGSALESYPHYKKFMASQNREDLIASQPLFHKVRKALRGGDSKPVASPKPKKAAASPKKPSARRATTPTGRALTSPTSQGGAAYVDVPRKPITGIPPADKALVALATSIENSIRVTSARGVEKGLPPISLDWAINAGRLKLYVNTESYGGEDYVVGVEFETPRELRHPEEYDHGALERDPNLMKFAGVDNAIDRAYDMTYDKIGKDPELNGVVGVQVAGHVSGRGVTKYSINRVLDSARI